MAKERPRGAERRQHARVDKIVDGAWQGASGTGDCRVSDLSVGGCFIQTLAMPAVGERTVVTLKTDGDPLAVAGVVRYIEQGMGFSVEFQGLAPDELEDLAQLLKSFKAAN